MNARTGFGALALAAIAMGATGCMGPTYGTGKSQMATLFDDLNDSMLLGGTSDSGEIAYAPREELRTPENTSVLPQPTPDDQRAISRQRQALAAQRQADARTQAQAQVVASRSTGDYDFSKNSDDADILSPQELERAGAQARALEGRSKAGDPNQRRYLTEPPTAYRQPSGNAPVGQMGEDESVKQQRIANEGKSLFGRIGEWF